MNQHHQSSQSYLTQSHHPHLPHPHSHHQSSNLPPTISKSTSPQSGDRQSQLKPSSSPSPHLPRAQTFNTTITTSNNQSSRQAFNQSVGLYPHIGSGSGSHSPPRSGSTSCPTSPLSSLLPDPHLSGNGHPLHHPHHHHVNHFDRSTHSTTTAQSSSTPSLEPINMTNTTLNSNNLQTYTTASSTHVNSQDHKPSPSPSSTTSHDPQRRPGFSTRNKASLCISTSASLPHSRLQIDHSASTPLSAQTHHFIHSPRPILPLGESQSAFLSPPPTASSTYHHPQSSSRNHELPQLSSSSSSTSSEDGTSGLVAHSQDLGLSFPQLLPVTDTAQLSTKASQSSQSVHVRHPSNSTSSIGPNVAGRIGVGGNVMVDPHNAASVAQKSGVGAGAFVYKVYNVRRMPLLSG